MYLPQLQRCSFQFLTNPFVQRLLLISEKRSERELQHEGKNYPGKSPSEARQACQKFSNAKSALAGGLLL